MFHVNDAPALNFLRCDIRITMQKMHQCNNKTLIRNSYLQNSTRRNSLSVIADWKLPFVKTNTPSSSLISSSAKTATTAANNNKHVSFMILGLLLAVPSNKFATRPLSTDTTSRDQTKSRIVLEWKETDTVRRCSSRRTWQDSCVNLIGLTRRSLTSPNHSTRFLKIAGFKCCLVFCQNYN